MPDVFIVGAPRCGTGALHKHLGMHPQIYAPAAKEPHYFARDIKAPGFFTDRDEYLALYRNAGEARHVVDGSVWNMFSKVAAPLIRAEVPDAKAIVMMRDPVELMRSLHARNFVFGDEDIADFATALEAEPERAVGRRLPKGGAFPEALLYSRVGRLGEQVSRLLETFPREDVHFVVLDDLEADPVSEYLAVLDFLDVDAWTPQSFDRHNPHRRQRSTLIARAYYGEHWSVRAVARKVLSPGMRMRVRSTALSRRIARANAPTAKREPLDQQLRDRLRQELATDVALLGQIVGRDLAGEWWGDAGRHVAH